MLPGNMLDGCLFPALSTQLWAGPNGKAEASDCVPQRPPRSRKWCDDDDDNDVDGDDGDDDDYVLVSEKVAIHTA